MRRGLLGTIVASVLLLGAVIGVQWTTVTAQEASPSPCPATTPEQNLATLQAYMTAVQSGDEATVDKILADDFSHNLSTPLMEVPNQPGNADEIEMLRRRAEIGDVQTNIIDQVASGDLVAIHFTMQFNPTNWNPAYTGDPLTADGLAMIRFKCGEISELMMRVNTVTLLLQAGYEIVPPGAATPTS